MLKIILKYSIVVKLLSEKQNEVRRPSLKYPPFATKRGQNPRNQANLVNKQVHTKLAQKICDVSLSIHPVINDLLPNRK